MQWLCRLGRILRRGLLLLFFHKCLRAVPELGERIDFLATFVHICSPRRKGRLGRFFQGLENERRIFSKAWKFVE